MGVGKNALASHTGQLYTVSRFWPESLSNKPLHTDTATNAVASNFKKDNSINLEREENSSILIFYPLLDIENCDNSAKVLIKLAVAQQYLLVRLTHKSVARLQLHIGQQVYAQIKTVALLSEP